MEDHSGPRLLEAFFEHAPKNVLRSMDSQSKAALRLSCKNAKAFVDGTVTAAEGEASALETILCCDWRLSELYINGDCYFNSSPSPNDFITLLHAVCSKFPTLQVLEMNSPPELYSLPANIGQLSKLSTLKIMKSELEALPASFGQLPSLERLELYEAYTPGAISRPWTIEGLAPLKQLTQLRYLKLGGVLVRQSFFPGWLGSCQFPVLEDLTLGHGMQSLPSSISNFRNLTALIIEGSGASEVPESICSLKLLKKLYLGEDAVSLPTSFSQLTALESLEVTTDMQSFALVEHCTELKELTFIQQMEEDVFVLYPEFLWTFTSLKELYLFRSSVASLPDALGNLKKLEWLCLCWHQNVEELPETFGYLTNLTSLEIGGCHRLLKLPESVENLKALRELEISYCEKLTTLPESIGHLQSLEKLRIMYLKRFESLPPSIGNLHALKELVLNHVGEALVFLPESFADLVLDKPAEECSLKMVSFNGDKKVVTAGSRVTQALRLLQERGVIRCPDRF
jgi:Leucine-rich repeat (LRR) protein